MRANPALPLQTQPNLRFTLVRSYIWGSGASGVLGRCSQPKPPFLTPKPPFFLNTADLLRLNHAARHITSATRAVAAAHLAHRLHEHALLSPHVQLQRQRQRIKRPKGQ